MRLLMVSCCLGLVAALPSEYDSYSGVSKPIAMVNENMAVMMGNAPIPNTMQAVEQSMKESWPDDVLPHQTTQDGGSEGDTGLEQLLQLLGVSPLNEESHDGEVVHSSKTESTSWSQTSESSSSLNVANAGGSISEPALKQEGEYEINELQDNSLAQTMTGSAADASASTAVVEEAVINAESSDDINSEEPASHANPSGGASSSAAATSSAAASAAAGGDVASSAAASGDAGSSAAVVGGVASSAAAGGDAASSSAAGGDVASSAAASGDAASSAAAGGDAASSAAAGGDAASSAAAGGDAASSTAASGDAASSAAAAGDISSSAAAAGGASSSAAAAGDAASSAAASGDTASSAAAVSAGASSSVATVADGDNASSSSSESALPSAADGYGVEEIEGDHLPEKESELIAELFGELASPATCVPFYLCSGGDVITDGAGVIDIRIAGKVDESQSHSMCPHPMDVYCRVPRSEPDPEMVQELIDYEYVPSCGHRNPGGVGFQLEGFKHGETQFGEFPWMSIVLEDEEVAYGQTIKRYVCGGSLIHPQAILTAAHCVYGKDASKLTIRLGEWDSFNKKEMLPYEEHRVAHMESHARFHSGNLRYDVAVLFLEEPVKLKQHVDTICLPEENENFDYSWCVATGFGKDRFNGGRFQNIMKQVDLPIMPHRQCQNRLRETRLGRRFRLHRTFTCAGGEDNVDTCSGDGGSPLVCPSKEDPDKYVQAGIVAWGIGCGEGGVPGVYASVPKLIKWVNAKMAGYFGHTVQKASRGKYAPPV